MFVSFFPASMTIFQFLADMMHVASFVFLIQRLVTSRSASGISLKTQEMYMLVFATRYLDIFTNTRYAYLVVMKLLYLALSGPSADLYLGLSGLSADLYLALSGPLADLYLALSERSADLFLALSGLLADPLLDIPFHPHSRLSAYPFQKDFMGVVPLVDAIPAKATRSVDQLYKYAKVVLVCSTCVPFKVA